jgi:hypothetical protein
LLTRWSANWLSRGKTSGSRRYSSPLRKLERLLALGLLVPIHLPSPELEAARDLVRAREDARLDQDP